jgi:hypothetical protein
MTQTTRNIRLAVNISPSVAAVLKEEAEARGINPTEAIRKAILIWKLVGDEQRKGNRICIVEGHGSRAKFKEVTLLP